MNGIVQKRTDLINFFLNKNDTYTKEEILNKEFAVLSFSPSEEYIDILKSDFDHICINPSTHVMNNVDEIYIKGIIVSIDRQNFQTIIHIQNKDVILSIIANGATSNKYDCYFTMGEPIIAKCKVYNEKIYLGFLIQLNHMEEFKRECEYINGISKEKITTIMSNRQNKKTHFGLIVECSLIKTKKGKDMVIGTLYDGIKKRSFGTVKTKYNFTLPKYAIAGDYVKFNKPTDKFFINNMEVVDL